MILIGAGNLRQALVNYMNLKNRGFLFKGAFDVNPALHDKKIANIPIYPMEQMSRFISENSIDIAVLTVPKAAAIEITQVLTQTPIKAIWNFAHGPESTGQDPGGERSLAGQPHETVLQHPAS